MAGFMTARWTAAATATLWYLLVSYAIYVWARAVSQVKRDKPNQIAEGVWSFFTSARWSRCGAKGFLVFLVLVVNMLQ